MPHPDIRNIGFLFKKNNLQIEIEYIKQNWKQKKTRDEYKL